MTRVRVSLVLATASSALLALSGCAGSSTTSTATSASGPAGASSPSAAGAATLAGKKILWVQPMAQHPVHRIMQAGFKAECEKLQATCDLVGNPSATNYDVPGTVALAEAKMATTKYDAALIYGPVPSINYFMTKVAGQGIPVVTWHVLPQQGAIQGLKAATGEDIENAGTNAAKAMGDKTGCKGTIAVTEGSFNDTENALAKSFKENLAKDCPDVKVLDPQEEGFEPSKAQAKAVSIIQGNPDIAGAFSTTGAGAATWAGAQRTSGKKIAIIGVDYTKENLDLIKGGQVYGIVAQPLYSESQKAVDLAAGIIQGKQVEFLNKLPAPVVTAEGQGEQGLQFYYDIVNKAAS